jgi:hypothetical protein
MSALKSKTIRRCFERYDSDTRASKMASHRQGYQQKQAVGEFYYVSDFIPGIAFPTRSRAEAAEAAEKASLFARITEVGV